MLATERGRGGGGKGLRRVMKQLQEVGDKGGGEWWWLVVRGGYLNRGDG